MNVESCSKSFLISSFEEHWLSVILCYGFSPFLIKSLLKKEEISIIFMKTEKEKKISSSFKIICILEVSYLQFPIGSFAINGGFSFSIYRKAFNIKFYFHVYLNVLEKTISNYLLGIIRNTKKKIEKSFFLNEIG